MRVSGLLLAAGAGSRMGRPKALVRDPDGRSWLTRSIEVLRAGGCDDVVVVLGAAAASARALLPEDVAAAGVDVVEAEAWAEGMSASLRAGLTRLGEGDAGAALVLLVDLPDLVPSVVARLLPLAAEDVLARAAYGGEPGHPVLLGRAHWAGVAETAAGDHGARPYLRSRAAHVRLVECGDLATGEDQDTPAG